MERPIRTGVLGAARITDLASRPGEAGLRAPEVFADYYGNNLIAAVCRAACADVLSRAVTEGWSRRQLETELEAWNARRQGRRP